MRPYVGAATRPSDARHGLPTDIYGAGAPGSPAAGGLRFEPEHHLGLSRVTSAVAPAGWVDHTPEVATALRGLMECPAEGFSDV